MTLSWLAVRPQVKKEMRTSVRTVEGGYLTAPSSTSSYVLTQPLQPQERKGGGADAALRQLALQMSRLLPKLFNLGVMLIPYM